ncbi:MAG: hypothetical protein K5846_06800 [Bacteroidales bacterium]|nr:hypothetical protein [Bacteroidales bacterium]
MKKFFMLILSALGVMTSCNREMVPPQGPPGGGENILMYGPPPVEYKNMPKADDNTQQAPNTPEQNKNSRKENNETDSENQR